MKARLLVVLFVMSVLALTCGTALAQGRGHGHDKDKNKSYRNSHAQYDDHDQEVMREWYREHEREGGLPPGLAKRDQLPPGLERQLVVRGELPPGLRKKIQPCPEELVRQLPPPPPDCDHVIIGGHIVLLNRRTSVVLDIFHLEL
jgi:Ni/Co efflux regulator RcnB